MESTIALFEEAFRLGQRPQIDDYLLTFKDTPQQLNLLVELVHTELELRLKLGEQLEAEDYLVRFPALAEDDAVLLGVVHAEFWHRQQRGEKPSYSDYHRRFPQFAGRLEAMARHADAFVASRLGCQSRASTEMQHQSPADSDPPTESRHIEITDVLDASVPLRVLRILEPHMSEREFSAGQYLLRQNEAGTSLMILCEGTVEIRVDQGAGGYRLIATVGAGRILGEMSLLTDEPCTASAVAITSVRALVLPAQQFCSLARQHHTLAGALTEIVADRLGGSPHDVLSGKSFYGCSIKRRLGRGGMSVVYEAEHLPTARRVALKMLSHRLVSDANALVLFEREADLIASFDHPHIIRTYGRFAAFGTYFTILEFAAGESLQQAIEARGPLPEAQVRTILAQVASALNYAHARQVLHRDLKPSNIMLASDGYAKLTDFGLATSFDLLATERPGHLIGTPQYMSPEQLAGQPLTKAADYFGLGCVAYEMLTGQKLFPERRLGAILRRHQAWSSRSFGELCPTASARLSQLLETSLHHDPLERRLDLAQLAAIDPTAD